MIIINTTAQKDKEKKKWNIRHAKNESRRKPRRKVEDKERVGRKIR